MNSARLRASAYALFAISLINLTYQQHTPRVIGTAVTTVAVSLSVLLAAWHPRTAVATSRPPWLYVLGGLVAVGVLANLVM